MRIRPRQNILELWQAQLRHCYPDGKWIWGGRSGENSISDAEQVLSLLYPATEIETFALNKPDLMAADVQAALAPFGSGSRIGSVLVSVLEEYFERYTDASGEPVFAAAGYLRSVSGQQPTERQQSLDTVDSYSMSLTLCIAALRFLRVFRLTLCQQIRKEATRLTHRILELEPRIRVRLTLAMTGLLRSFVIHTPRPDSVAGQNILRMVNQTGASETDLIAGMSKKLDQVRVQLASDVKLGQKLDDTDYDLSDDALLFECGWSWGVHENSAIVDRVTGVLAHRPGYAVSRPNLYFTVVALDGIADLISQRAQEVELLHEDQRELADALKLRWELAQRYWSIIARYDTSKWPLEDFPWRLSDGHESDYYSLALAAVTLEDFAAREATDDLPRLAEILGELARRGRIVSRVTVGDAGGALHDPGVLVPLSGGAEADGEPELVWTVSDFTTLLLKRCLKTARLISDVPTRDGLLELAVAAWEHLDKRRLRTGAAAGLWDNASKVAGLAIPNEDDAKPSWYITERVIECLVGADGVYRSPVLATTAMVNRAVELLNEADHLLNREMLETGGNLTALDRIEQCLEKARSIIHERPATAFSLAEEALLELYNLSDARADAMRMA